jgi:hypothetical protein
MPVLFLAVLVIAVAIPGLGALEAVPSAHVAKHEAGTLPASAINEAINRGQCRWFYSALYQQHLALVEISGQCGGAVFRRNHGGALIEVTAFGGSECVKHSAGSCGYWWCCIERGGYVPVAAIGG